MYVFSLHLDYQRLTSKAMKKYAIVEFLNYNASLLFFMHQIDLEIVFPVGDVIDNIEPLIVFRWRRRRPA